MTAAGRKELGENPWCFYLWVRVEWDGEFGWGWFWWLLRVRTITIITMVVLSSSSSSPSLPNSILHSTDWLKGKMLLLKLLPFSHVSRVVLDYMENSFSNKPSTNRKYPLGFFFSILIALSTISLMDGSPAVSFGRSTSYCIWEYSKSPVWKRKSLDCEAHLDLDENRWKSCKYKRNSINTDSN